LIQTVFNSAGVIKVRTPGNGLATGDQITIANVTGTGNIGAISNNNFTVTVAGGAVGDASSVGGIGTGPIVITSINHKLTNGTRVTVSGVQGNTNANGTCVVNVVDADHFQLVGTTSNAAPTAATGSSTDIDTSTPQDTTPG